jgi:hypothetical protein
MKALLIGIAALCFSLPTSIRQAYTQDVDSRCNEIYDKTACTCAVQNGGRIIPPPVGVKREGLKLQPHEGMEATRTLDGGRVAFHNYFRREGFKVHKSRALEAYLTCMHRNGRK